MLKIPWIKPKLWGSEKEHLIKAFDSSWFSSGSYVDQLEAKFKEIHQVKHCITTCNGTASIYLILDRLNLKSTDKVIVPGFAFGAAANMVSSIGAQNLFCDVDEQTMLIDPNKLEQILQTEKNIKAIIPVHSYGNVCEMPTIMDLASYYKITVIEDVAEAMFSRLNNKLAGTFGHFNSFSFQTTKTVTTGEGGCILTNNDEMAEKMRLVRSHGMGVKKYWHHERGNNFRLSNLLASIGYAQLEHVEQNISSRVNTYQNYLNIFQNVDELKIQKINRHINPVMWAFPILIDQNFSNLSRDEIIENLAEKGIETRPGFYTFEQMRLYNAPMLKNSDYLAKNIICLPFYPDLSQNEIEYIHREVLKLKR